jgi:DNA-directed RNA polymerase specialized sigma24 family protein
MSTEYLNNKVLEASIQRFQRLKKEKTKCQLIMEDYTQSLGKRKSKKLLADHKKFSEAYDAVVVEYVQSQHELASHFYELSNNLFNFAKFAFLDVDDAIQEGVMICFEKIDRFNPNYVGKGGQKAKAFNYLTTCILNHFRQLYRSARNYNELKRKYTDYVESQCNGFIVKNRREFPTSDSKNSNII